jgi:hypothetical protein
MSSQSIVCASCNAAVPYGRLSCPGCGELLASVTGAARPTGARVAKRSSEGSASAVLLDAPPAAPVAALATALTAPAVPSPWPSLDDGPQWPEDRPAAAVATVASPPVSPERSDPSPPAAPGAYVPPALPATPAGPPAPARAWAGQPTGDEATAGSERPRTSSASHVDAARLTEFIGWLAVAGSAMAAVGFLLPWGVSVIGAAGVGYFDRWGLAGPFHPVVFVSVLGVLAAALVRNPVPLWIRVGLPGFGLSALLVGLVWPYLVGLPGIGPGALVVAVGALLLGVAGVMALVTDRHGTEDRSV